MSTSSAVQELKEQELLKEGLVEKLPTPSRVLSSFFKSSELYRFSGIIFKAKASIDRNIVLEHHESKYRKTLLSVMSAYKHGKVECLDPSFIQPSRRVSSSTKVKSKMNEAWEI